MSKIEKNSTSFHKRLIRIPNFVSQTKNIPKIPPGYYIKISVISGITGKTEGTCGDILGGTF